MSSWQKIQETIEKLRRITTSRGATRGEEQAAKNAIDRFQAKLGVGTAEERNRETLEAYMIREMAEALKLWGGKPDEQFYQAAERDRYRLGHGPWTPYEQRIKQKWEQGRSYSADLAETLRQQAEQWEARERWRAERNRKRRAEDAENPQGNSSARGRKVFLAEMAGWLLGWLAIFGYIYFAVWLGHAVRSSTLSYLMVLIGMFVLFRLNSGKWKFWSRPR